MGWDGSEAVGCAGVGYLAEVRRVQGYHLVLNIIHYLCNISNIKCMDVIHYMLFGLNIP